MMWALLTFQSPYPGAQTGLFFSNLVAALLVLVFWILGIVTVSCRILRIDRQRASNPGEAA